MSDYDMINGEILTVTVTVDEETVIANINTAAALAARGIT
jgi:hypothetical protein